MLTCPSRSLFPAKASKKSRKELTLGKLSSRWTRRTKRTYCLTSCFLLSRQLANTMIFSFLSFSLSLSTSLSIYLSILNCCYYHVDSIKAAKKMILVKLKVNRRLTASMILIKKVTRAYGKELTFSVFLQNSTLIRTMFQDLKVKDVPFNHAES